MLSTSGKAGLIRELSQSCEFAPYRQAWTTVIERTCIEVLTRVRAGIPAVDFTDYVPRQDGISYRLWPMLEERQAHLLFGDGGQGKSLLATLFGVLTVLGRDHLGLTANQGSVAYLDYETDIDRTMDRVNLLAHGLAEAMPAGFGYMPLTQTVAADYERINRHVRDKKRRTRDYRLSGICYRGT